MFLVKEYNQLLVAEYISLRKLDNRFSIDLAKGVKCFRKGSHHGCTKTKKKKQLS
jgi:hypothetical protein